MDEATKDLLQKWNLSHYIQRFEAERIDIVTMTLLNIEDIRNIFPQIGDRVRFEAMLATLRKEESDHQPQDVDNASINSSILEQVLRDQLEFDPAACSSTSSSGNHQGRQGNLDILVIPLDSSSGPSLAQDTDKEASKINSILAILKESTEGRQIVEIGQKTGALPCDVRGRLCKLLMEKLITTENPILQTDAQLLALSHDIGRLFKKESPPLYYAPYLPADAYQAKRNTSGWLVAARRARRQHLVCLGLLEKPKSRSRSKSNPTRDTSYPGIDISSLEEGDAEEVASALAQLSSPAAGPWQEISALWRETVRARLRYLYYEEGTLLEYFTKYPILKSNDGWRLLTHDYEALFPDNCRGLDAFNASTDIILKAAQQKHLSTKDKFLSQKIKTLVAICDDAKPETKINAALLLLGCLFNIPPARRSKKDWHASRAEILDGFITIVETEADVNVTIEERRQKLLGLGITLQPFIIWCRVTDASFIVIDNTLYKFPTLPEAVDVTFKIFHATAAKYPTESYNIWLIVQVGFYKVKTSYDRMSQSVKETLVNLGVSF